MKHTITILILLILTACGSMGPEDQIIKDELFVLGQEVVEIKCNPPLKRTRDDGSIFILIAEEWEPVYPYKKLKLKNGTMVSIDIELLDKHGKSFMPSSIGSAGGSIRADFNPEISKQTRIQTIRLKSSSIITVKMIIWHNFNPL
jgi:hypothetical protein